jgi:hypothetical protein
VARLNDLIDAEAGIRGIVRAAAGSGDPREAVAAPARVVRSIIENCGDIVRAVVTGAAAEPELAAVLAEGHRRHVDGARRVVGLLQRLDGLDPSVEPDQAAETLAVLSDASFALMLRDDYGWSPERIETWITETSRTLLLR